MILVDTNILARMANQGDPDYKQTHDAIRGCWRRDRKLYVASQSLYEFWTVATRPASKNGLDMPPPRANRYVQHYSRAFLRVPDQEAAFETWRSLVLTHGITGIRAHDVRLVALLGVAGLTHLMTYNLAHFRGMPVLLVDPRDPATW